jgi:hypothetical protein
MKNLIKGLISMEQIDWRFVLMFVGSLALLYITAFNS